jgi:hypothetical protein
MDTKNILSIEPNLSLLKLVKFYGIIKKDKEWHPPFAATAWVFSPLATIDYYFFRILFRLFLSNIRYRPDITLTVYCLRVMTCIGGIITGVFVYWFVKMEKTDTFVIWSNWFCLTEKRNIKTWSTDKYFRHSSRIHY